MNEMKEEKQTKLAITETLEKFGESEEKVDDKKALACDFRKGANVRIMREREEEKKGGGMILTSSGGNIFTEAWGEKEREHARKRER